VIDEHRPGLITISIPTFRRPSLLLHALHSCFTQDYRPLEIDIGDDSDGRETQRLVETLTTPPGVVLRYWRNRPGLGQVGNVNSLFSRARGARLMLLHDDDVLLPGAVSALAKTFSLSNAVIAAYGIQEVISEHGEASETETLVNNEHANRTPTFTGLQTKPVVCALWRQFPNNGYLIDAEIARRIGYRDVRIVGNANDVDFAIRVATENRNSAFYFLNRRTSQYRLSNGSIRGQHDTCRRFYAVLEQLPLASEAERRARDWLLEKIAEEAVVDHALHGEWKSALRIMSSKYYPRAHRPAKSIFHLAIIAFPGLYSLRALRREAGLA
jgi:glycosyltransferase involved in cell wall biosynthesis